ncbi:hypothetical protein BGV48_18535 [Burkholderia ubonensis]|nr:hypothetical protein BGV48_18535 [Burkholderia ubonensis]
MPDFVAVSALSRFRQMRRRIAKFWAALLTRTLHWFSPKAMSSAQCMLFSIRQCARTACAIRAASGGRLDT